MSAHKNSSVEETKAVRIEQIAKAKEELLEKLRKLEAALLEIDLEVEELVDVPNMTTSERMRLMGSGVKRYGFLDKVSDIATDFPDYFPRSIDPLEFKETIREIEILRNMVLSCNTMVRIMTDKLLLLGDEAYRAALAYYRAVEVASRGGDQQAQIIYRTLRQFFQRHRTEHEEPTIDGSTGSPTKQLLHDFNALRHGTKDGKIIIENEKPHTTGGKHVVIDDVHKHKQGSFKETESGEIEE
jgi:hypothetical protein